MRHLAIFALISSATALPLWNDFKVGLPEFLSRLSGQDNGHVAPLMTSLTSKPVDDHYIVVLKPGLTHEHKQKHHAWVNLLHTQQESKKRGFKHAFDIASAGVLHGYTGHFDEETLEEIRRHEHVAYVERDQMMYTQDVEKDVPSWGLARISYRKHPSSTQFKSYVYDHAAGENVTAYIIDTGVNIHHEDFEGRAIWGKTVPEDDEDADGNGHGTHVAGTVAGKKFGVAKKATIKAVKVLRSNGSGTLSDVIRGIEWAVADHLERLKKAKEEAGDESVHSLLSPDGDEPENPEPQPPKKKVRVKSTANMSLGGGRARTLDEAVDVAVRAGIHFAVAAGNDARDACEYSPAASELAVTVGSSSIDDTMSWFSNHGKCVDVFGPGRDITSAWIGSNVATNTISGTSMASPHVCGLLTLLLSEPDHDMSPKKLKDLVIKLSTKGVVKGLPIWSKTENRLIFNDPPVAELPGDDGDDDGDDDDDE